VPVFNKGVYLEETLASLEAQNYPQLEVIIVNDGSTDDSAAVVDRMPQRFPALTIRCYHKPNGGASDARNFAIERARGLFIANMDADDIMRPGFLIQAMEAVSKLGVDVVYSDLELFGDRTGEWIPAPFDPYFIRHDNCVSALALYRRELWEKSGGYNVCLPFNEDWNFFVGLAALGAKFHKIPAKLFAYRQTGTGLYHNFIREAWEWGSPMIMTTRPELFGVDEVLSACKKLSEMPERWAAKFERQHATHPSQWLLKLWLGLFQEGKGNTAGAISYYQDAANACGLSAWLPLYKLGQLAEPIEPNATIQLYHRVRTQRPDMARYVNPVIERLLQEQISRQAPAR